MIRGFILAYCTLVCLSCSKKMDENKTPTEQLSKLSVGMTYEEVEGLLRKPQVIDRGINSLDFKTNLQSLTSDELKCLTEELNKLKANPDSSRLALLLRILSTPAVESSGQLMYVTWVYTSIGETTKSFNVLPIFGERPDTILSPKYFMIDGVRFTKAEMEYKYGIYYDQMYKPKKVYEKIVSKNTFLNDLRRVPYLVYNSFCVVFDASSGRLVKSDYFPFAVARVGESKQ